MSDDLTVMGIAATAAAAMGWLSSAPGVAVAARLSDAPKSGAPAKFGAEQICAIIAIACEPPSASDRPITQWSQQEVTPTSASWINQVERWFAELTRKQLQRGVHTSTRQLEADIRAFIEKHNEDPKPFRWAKSADDILAAVKRFCLRVDQNLCHEL